MRLLNRAASMVFRFWPGLAERAAGRWASIGGSVPFVRPAPALATARVAIVSAAGVHLASDPPFDMDDPDGDASFRVIPRRTEPSQLQITHDYYDHRAADRDVNLVFPLMRLEELAADGVVGEVAPRHVGFMGHLRGTPAVRLLEVTAPAIARLLVDDGVTATLLVPG